MGVVDAEDATIDDIGLMMTGTKKDDNSNK